jgi:ferredoxin-thioredoxin reductase catalytic chain
VTLATSNTCAAAPTGPTRTSFDGRGEPAILVSYMSADERDEEQQVAEARRRIQRMVNRYVERGRYAFNPDPVTVEHVMAGLARNLLRHGRAYCPCREVAGDPAQNRKNICPCPQHHGDIARDGVCECGIFVSEHYAKAHSTAPAKAHSTAPNLHTEKEA